MLTDPKDKALLACGIGSSSEKQALIKALNLSAEDIERALEKELSGWEIEGLMIAALNLKESELQEVVTEVLASENKEYALNCLGKHVSKDKIQAILLGLKDSDDIKRFVEGILLGEAKADKLTELGKHVSKDKIQAIFSKLTDPEDKASFVEGTLKDTTNKAAKLPKEYMYIQRLKKAIEGLFGSNDQPRIYQNIQNLQPSMSLEGFQETLFNTCKESEENNKIAKSIYARVAPWRKCVEQKLFIRAVRAVIYDFFIFKNKYKVFAREMERHRPQTSIGSN